MEAPTLKDKDKHSLRLWFLEHIGFDAIVDSPATVNAIETFKEIQQSMQCDREKWTSVKKLKDWVQALQGKNAFFGTAVEKT